MPRPTGLGPVFAAAILAATPAAAFTAINDLVVEPSGPDAFNVPWRGDSGAPSFWCAAGDYVIRGLGLSPATRVFRTSPVPRPRGEGIVFSLSPDNATDTGMVVLGSPDKGLSAGHARALCLDPRPEFD